MKLEALALAFPTLYFGFFMVSIEKFHHVIYCTYFKVLSLFLLLLVAGPHFELIALVFARQNLLRIFNFNLQLSMVVIGRFAG